MGRRVPRRRSEDGTTLAELHDATEHYLETIFSLEEEGVRPIRARIVERLGLSAAAVSETVERLIDQGHVELLADRGLQLTPQGRRLATSVIRRHRLAERLLHDVIGIEWEKVHIEADRWEHAISSEVEAKLVELLGDPGTCPHGNPIPGSAHRENLGPTTTLAQASLGEVRVARVSEKLELDDDGIRLVAQAGLTPGCDATVIESGRDSVSVRTATGEHRVPPRVAEQLHVTVGV